MSANTFSTGINSSVPPIPTTIAKQMLITPVPTLIAGLAASHHEILAAEGTAKLFVGVDNFPLLAPVNTAATQGPAPLAPTYYSTTISTQTFAQSVIIAVTSRISSQIPWLAKIIANMRVASLRTEDNVIATALLQSASVYTCTNGTNGQPPTNMSNIDAANVVQLQRINNAPDSSQAQAASVLFNTYGVTQGYIMLTSLVGSTSFTTQSSNLFIQTGSSSMPQNRVPGEIGKFTNGITVIGSTQWPGTGSTTALGYPIIKGSVMSLGSYTRLVHPEMFHRVNVVGSAYLGINNLQEGGSVQWWGGAGILQPTWVRSVVYSGITVELT